MPAFWLLNLTADEELRAPEGPRTPAGAEARMEALTELLLPLLGPNDKLFHGRPASDEERARGSWVGRAWMMTPRAIDTFKNMGIRPIKSPSMEVLRRVNSRKFAATLGIDLPGAAFVSNMDQLTDRLQDAPIGPHWLLRRPHGFSGRGRQRVDQGEMKPAAFAWSANAFREEGGLEIVPYVKPVKEAAIHGFIAEDGTVTLGEPTVQVVDAKGQWVESRRAEPGDLEDAECESLKTTAQSTADALRKAGYFGPFGIDGMRWRTGEHRGFAPRIDVNARYTMGWAIGMGDRRPDLAVE
jgi:hypothetical protein